MRLFCEYLLDRRYPWVAICRERLDAEPQHIVDEPNLIVHVAEFEADPHRRPLSRAELQAFFDHCDAQVAGRHALKRKGSLAALRDAALFKTIYAWGCVAGRPPSSTSSTSRATRQGGVRRVRCVERALRQGDGVGAAEAAQRRPSGLLDGP
jgi:hypothetical protein